ncbi:CPBP family glutamic-type intramembrane protease [Leifsonia sp. F6_8S_P_1B]|uniref:CPBP family glutamic-type intramembrane protease n=1 Tax=Leifsonia williamsii TaxID=3035919 RepID=A0ABT8K973_9MICO|nr:CPBP family glutamic-type intramembrane protease [Leifsonia williamsii]MDN4612869.1 CPBP family glutamic-type intramembrane protease [Leifsonia williamsii]
MAAASAAVLGLIGVAISWDRIGGDASPLMPLERPPVLVTIVVVAALAAANAGAEEALWRVALLSEQSADPAPNMWLAQAMSFGIAHWAGLPYGPAGVLASGTLSLVLMLARARYGFLRVLIIHGVVDVVIFAAVFMFAIYPPS